MKREEHIEHAVRRRLAEALTNVGVGYDRISLEVLYFLPPAFLDAYVDLYMRAFKDASGGGAGDTNAISVKKTKATQIGPASNNSGKKYREHWQIRDDRAFARKRRIDRKLLKLVGEMRTGESGDDKHKIRCYDCGRWAQGNWKYCGWCGIKMKSFAEKEEKEREEEKEDGNE